jgi:hypothetical protein
VISRKSAGRLMAKFAKTVTDWVRKSTLAMEAVAKEASQGIVEEVTKPRAKGGRMPVLDGFLRNSMAGALNSIPSGEGMPDKGYKNTDFDMAPTALVINKLKAGDRLVLGFTAVYARPMEFKYFFVRSAAQNWPLHVNKAIKKVSRSIR